MNGTQHADENDEEGKHDDPDNVQVGRVVCEALKDHEKRAEKSDQKGDQREPAEAMHVGAKEPDVVNDNGHDHLTADKPDKKEGKADIRRHVVSAQGEHNSNQASKAGNTSEHIFVVTTCKTYKSVNWMD